ncbi:hypothetical protein PBI_SUZY_72 [Gordonia phage Suzy]|uniref:Uncharacterized protein n=1 Tax=Gordonia phage Suzy TaxID=2201430 RepID=A0A2Z4Q7W3_9CAUD|nr:hypothetical protein HOT44_gp72 [Gordonia phage Suzy]AWY06176.1 hypothetical protein PBI_SUZY_72 [Gordonia phage Suzy]
MQEDFPNLSGRQAARADHLVRTYTGVFTNTQDATINLGERLSLEFSVQGSYGVKLQFTNTALRQETKYQEINIPFEKTEWKVSARTVTKIVKAILFVEEIYS